MFCSRVGDDVRVSRETQACIVAVQQLLFDFSLVVHTLSIGDEMLAERRREKDWATESVPECLGNEPC